MLRKRIIMLLLTSMLIFALILAGCSINSMQEPPEISINIGDKEIEYVSAKNKWNGSIYDREDTFVTILKKQKEIPVFENGSVAEITFKNNPPDKFTVMDMLINEDGNQIYTDKEIKNIPIESNNGKYSFEIDYHFASALSSFYEPGKTDIRGFRMIASWGENECEYAFVIKTYTKSLGEQPESESSKNEIDRSKYLTGEIVTDGVYTYPTKGFGIIYFVPDEESSEIIKEKYKFTEESLQLKYVDVTKVENLPKELGIFKVKADIDWNQKGRSFILNDIQLTDKIGTVLYEGKTYDTNELDENVKVKDKVCGLIVKWIFRDEDEGGIQIKFAGEIESEGFYSISNDLMYGESIGRIYFDEEYFDNIPFIASEKRNNFCFFKTNELFDKLQNFSSFGKGKFKTSNFLLIYNIGMGRPVSEYLTEIISLDEAYKNMVVFDKNTYVGLADKAKDFIIISSANYDDNQNHISTDYYYVNKNNPKKLFLFSSDSYNYDLKIAANENEFVMSTNGYNYMTGEDEKGHVIIFKIAESGVGAKTIEGLSIDSSKIDDNGISYNIQGYISEIKINENNVIITLTDIKMKKEDELAFGNSPSEVNILIVDSNKNGPYISVGDKIMINCKHTIDKVLYSFGDDISLRK